MLSAEQKKKVEQENEKIDRNLRHVRHRIAVFSGKGGVGKTTVSVNLAYALKERGKRAAILDADVTGPNVPKMLGLDGQLSMHDGRIFPAESRGVKIVSIAQAVSPDRAIIWRGPMRSKLLQQFLGDVEWGELDYLVADLPPGTGDEIMTITQKMQPDLAIIVTTPQEVSLIDSRRAISMARTMHVPRIAVIENMSGLLCPQCGHRIDLFGSGGGRGQASAEGVLFLGEVPIGIEARILADEGRPVVVGEPGSKVARAFTGIAESVEKVVDRHDVVSEVPA
jgi:ATP-binding protein involved in chromosome partitioning